MKLSNAIKRASKFGKVQNNNGQYWVNYKGYVVSFHQNGRIEDDAATCFHTKRQGEESDSMTDYFPGVFWDNLKQCFDHVDRTTA